MRGRVENTSTLFWAADRYRVMWMWPSGWEGVIDEGLDMVGYPNWNFYCAYSVGPYKERSRFIFSLTFILEPHAPLIIMSKRRHLLTLSAAALVSLPATTVLGATLCVQVSEANLRQGPGTQFDKSWEVFKFMPFKKLDQKGDWFQVQDLDGDKHWVFRPLVSESLRCAVVKAKEANVRTGPGTDHAKAAFSPVTRYYSFKVLAEKGDWVQVEDEVQNAGWIIKSLLWMP